MNRIKVLHLFYQYLNITENWAYHLIDHLPNTDIVIASQHFLKNNFYPSKFKYLEFPIKPIEQNTHWRSVRLFNKVVLAIAKLCPWYVAKIGDRVDMMHSHFSFVGWEYRKLSRKFNIPHIVSFYGVDYESLPFVRPKWRRRYKTLFNEADLFLCEGRHGVEILEKMGCPRQKIKILPLGIKIEEIPFYRRDKQPEELKLLQIATLVEKKGHIYTVQAFIEALKECPNMTLTLVGRDIENIKDKLLQIIRESRAGGKVSFLERIDFNDLYSFMKDYHVFIHPSCYSKTMDCEGGAPIVLLDAQATGMPVISTAHCDIPDEVIHGKSGFLTPEKDVIPLAQSIKRFYQMKTPEYMGFAEYARQHVEKNYDVRNSSEVLQKIYLELWSRHRQSSH